MDNYKKIMKNYNVIIYNDGRYILFIQITFLLL